MNTKRRTQSLNKIQKNIQKLHDHPLNNSHAKHLFSFPKQKRFIKYKHENVNPEFYDFKSLFEMGKRAYSQGKSLRYDFTKMNKKVPGMGQYELKYNSIGNPPLNTQLIKFALSRDQCAIVGQNINKHKDLEPGPGKYDIPSLFNPNNSGYSFRIRTKEISNHQISLGPGQYQNNTLFGKQTLSKFYSGGLNKINPENKENSKHSIRLNKYKQMKKFRDTFYETKHQINAFGTYYSSRFFNSKVQKFGQEKKSKVFEIKKEVPGPGNYECYSDFGKCFTLESNK